MLTFLRSHFGSSIWFIFGLCHSSVVWSTIAHLCRFQSILIAWSCQSGELLRFRRCNFTRPPPTMTALTDFSPAFAQLVANSEVSEKFIIFLKAKKIFSTESMAFLATSETDVKDDILVPAAAGGVDITVLIDRSNIKKLWTAARRSMKTEVAL